MESIKDRFNQKVIELYSTKRDNSVLMTKEEYDELLSLVSRLKHDLPSITKEYRVKKKYDLLCVGDTRYLISKPVSILWKC